MKREEIGPRGVDGTGAAPKPACSNDDSVPAPGGNAPDGHRHGPPAMVVVVALERRLGQRSGFRYVPASDGNEAYCEVWWDRPDGSIIRVIRQTPNGWVAYKPDGTAELVEPVPPAGSADSFRPFPVDVLPAPLAGFTQESASALGCDPSYVALPVLCAASAAIGTTRSIELKATWREYPIVWAGLVARSGTLKTPAFDAALGPLHGAQTDALRAYGLEHEAYERAELEYERDVAAWRKTKTGAPPKKPAPPTQRRFVIADATIEAVAPILQANPRGVLLGRDELAGWIRGFDAYKAKGRGGDAAAWLELWRAGTLIIDRKTGDQKTIYVPRAAISVCGTIQPGVLFDVLTTEHFENGLAARLLLAQPPVLVKRWSERVPRRATVAAYESLIQRLLALQHTETERGPEPVCLPLSAEARAEWAAWYDRHATRIDEAETDREAAALAKIEAYAARFALIFTLAIDRRATVVSADAMRRGIALADWFAHETARVYSLFTESDEDRARRRLVEWITRRGGRTTVRELQQGCRRFRDSAVAAERALQDLVDAGRGRWELPQPGPQGGRPTRAFVLSTPSTVYETSAECVRSAGSVDVDAVDGAGGPDEGCPVEERPPDSVYENCAEAARHAAVDEIEI